MSISKKLSLSLLSLTLVGSNSFGMQQSEEDMLKLHGPMQEENDSLKDQLETAKNEFMEIKLENSKLRKQIDKQQELLADYRKELLNAYTNHAKDVEESKLINQIKSYLQNHMNRSAVHQVGFQAALELGAIGARRILESSSLSDEAASRVEEFIDTLVKAGRCHLAAVTITGGMNMAKNTSMGGKVLNKDKEYHANAYASFIAYIATDFAAKKFGNDTFVSKAAPFVVGTAAGVAAGFAPQKNYIN